MYERLKAYKRKFGNCLVPNRYPLDTQLGSWVSAQRRQYKIVTSGGNESAAMTPERAKKLRELGFEWSTTNPRNVPWEVRYKELEDFVTCYGHAEVPMRWEENPQLSNWVSKQRHQYKLMQSNRSSRLNMKKVNLLNKIGFVWEASRRRLGDGRSGSDEDDEDDEDDEVDSHPEKKVAHKKPRHSSKAKVVRKRRSLDGSVNTDSSDASSSLQAIPPGENHAFAQAAHAQALAMAGQGAALPGSPNFGLWAAMAASQASLLQNQAMAAAAGNPVDPRVLMQMNAMMAFGTAVPGIPFNPALASSMMPNSLPLHPGFRAAGNQNAQDPPGNDANDLDGYTSEIKTRGDAEDPE